MPGKGRWANCGPWQYERKSSEVMLHDKVANVLHGPSPSHYPVSQSVTSLMCIAVELIYRAHTCTFLLLLTGEWFEIFCSICLN